MKISTTFRAFALAILLTAWIAPTLVAQSFEGVVEMKTKSEQGSPTLTYMMKGGNARIEFESPRGKGIMLHMGKEEKNYMLMTGMQMYMEIGGGAGAEQAAEAKKPGIKKTGKTEKILGYDAEQIMVTTEDADHEVWAAKGIGEFVRFTGMGRRQQQGAQWEGMAEFKGYFPLRIVSKDKEGNEKSSLEVTKIEKKPLDGSLFQIPSDYKKMDPGAMGRPRGN